MKLLKNIKISIAILVASLSFASCIENDVPYPRIQPNFISITADHQSQTASIDTINRKITLFLNDSADIKNVNISSYVLTEGASIVAPQLTGSLDLSQPINVTVKLYQEYNWVISASQNIERYFNVSNQIGVSSIDVTNRRVIAYVSTNADITKINVKSIKLGSSQSTITPIIEGNDIDFSSPVSIEVSDYGRTETWTLYVVPTQSEVVTNRVDAWSQVAWVHGSAEAGSDNGVEYRLATESQWTKVPADWVSHNGGDFTARIIHLQPNTAYVARAYSGAKYGEEIDFTTGSIVQVPNSGFESWWKNDKVWNPWEENGVSYWDTGNKGATTLGQSNRVPTTETATGTGYAAMLETKFVGIGAVGKLAAGNLFTGSYVRTDGTNGILHFGREFTQRPTKLKGYLKYNCATISHSNVNMKHLIGQPDTCTVWVALADWETPFEIRTNPSNRQLFDENDPHVIAYGRLQYGETVPEYTPFEVEFNYRDTQRVPRYIVIVASASKYGDFFTGGDGSVLLVDEFELEYDY